MYSLDFRYQQMGNAVCPMVASALGRCLALAVVAAAPDSLEQAVVSVPDPTFVKVSLPTSTSLPLFKPQKLLGCQPKQQPW